MLDALTLLPPPEAGRVRVLIGCERDSLIGLSAVECEQPVGCYQHADRPNRNGSNEDHVMAEKALPSPVGEGQCRQIPGFPKYLARDDGEIISMNKNAPFVMKRRPHRNGYNLVTLCNGDVRLTTTLHRVIAMAFCENQCAHPCVRHLDGDKTNNRPENLAWGSYADNEQDKVILGRRRYGTAKMKLRRADRNAIFQEANCGVSQAKLALRYNVDASTISRLLNGKTWSNRKWPFANGAETA